MRNQRYLPSFPRARCSFSNGTLPKSAFCRFSRSLSTSSEWKTRARIGGLHFLERQSGVLECHSICVNGSPIWIQDDDRLWNEIDDAPKLFFILTVLGLRALEIIDIRCGRIPADEAPLLVPDRLVTREEPTILAILAQCSLFHLEGKAAFQRRFLHLLQPGDVVGVEDALAKRRSSELFCGEAEIVEGCLVDVEQRAARVQDANHLCDGVDDQARIVLA